MICYSFELYVMEGEDVTGKFIGDLSPEHKEENYGKATVQDIQGTIDIHSIGSASTWRLFGRILPKNEVIFICQVVILYIVIITCIANLSMRNGDSNLWTALLSSSLGIMLPQPTLSSHKH
jgi:hypothetical protein